MARILAVLAVLVVSFAQETPSTESSETPPAPAAEVAAPVESPAVPEEPVAAAPVEPEIPEAPEQPEVAAPIATPAPVAPAAPVVTPAPQAPVTPVGGSVDPDPPADLEGDNLIAFHRDFYLNALAKANIIGNKGCWLYGDYINGVPNVKDPVSCAMTCESDLKCYHWNFQVMSKRCDLKAFNGGVNRDISDWITGDAVRYTNAPAIVP